VHHSLRTIALAAALCALAACEEPTRPTSASPPPAQSPAARDVGLGGSIYLGTLGGHQMEATSINNKGVALGYADDGNGNWSTWTSADGAPMVAGPSYLQGIGLADVYAINDAGDIVGLRYRSGVPAGAFLARRDGTIIDVPTPSGPPDPLAIGSDAFAINSEGDVAGSYVDAAGTLHAALWRSGTTLVELGALPGTTCQARGINDADEVVGFCTSTTNGDEQRPFYWSESTNKMTDLGLVGAARDINNAGVVTGYAVYNSRNQAETFLWTLANGTRWVSPPTGYDQMFPQAINDNGLFVGLCLTSTGTGRACAGTADTGTWIVSDFGEQASSILSVNNSGVGLGIIRMPDAPARAVEWHLVPPSTTDVTAPVITPTVTGTSGLGGWYTSDVSLSFSESDPESGVSSTSGCDAVVVNQDTANATFTCAATNGAGLTSQVTSTIKRDATPPSVAYADNAGTYTVDQTVAITCTATDATSGIASTTCADIGGDAYTFALGTNTFSATANDLAGNIGTGQTAFTVEVTFASLGALTDRWVSNTGVAHSLNAKLDAAAAAAASGNVDAAAGEIDAYLHQVEAQSGKKIDADKAAILEQLAATL
jgi:FIMAH domain-containing protein